MCSVPTELKLCKCFVSDLMDKQSAWRHIWHRLYIEFVQSHNIQYILFSDFDRNTAVYQCVLTELKQRDPTVLQKHTDFYIQYITTLVMLNTAQTYQAYHHHIEFHFLVTKYFHFCKVLITRENTGSFLVADCGIKVTKKEILSWNSTSTFKQLSINPQIIFSVT